MKTLLILICMVVIASAAGFWHRHMKSEQSVPENALVRVGGRLYEAEVVRTPEALSKGLGERSGLPENEGMLFVFDEPARHAFWMTGMRFALDIIWIDKDSRIVHVIEKAPISSRETFIPSANAIFVLEVNAGEFEKSGARVGDVIEIK